MTLAELPGCMASPSERLRYVLTPIVLALHLCHSAATSVTPFAEVCDACLDAVRSLVALFTTEVEVVSVRFASFWLGALQMASDLFEAAPQPHRLPMLKMMLLLAGALPDCAEAANAVRKAYDAVHALLDSENACQAGALQMLQGLLQDKVATLSLRLHSHLRAVMPEAAPLLLRSAEDAPHGPAALKVLLLVCALAPPDGLLTCLSITLPLLVSCMWITNDGSISAARKVSHPACHVACPHPVPHYIYPPFLLSSSPRHRHTPARLCITGTLHACPRFI